MFLFPTSSLTPILLMLMASSLIPILPTTVMVISLTHILLMASSLTLTHLSATTVVGLVKTRWDLMLLAVP